MGLNLTLLTEKLLLSVGGVNPLTPTKQFLRL